MNGVGEYVVFYAPETVQAKAKGWRSMLVQRVISMLISIAIAAAVWYFFAAQIGAWGPWLVGVAAAIGLFWVIVSLVGLLVVRRDGRQVQPGPAFAVTRDGVWTAQVWLTWPEVAAVLATPGGFGRSARLTIRSRDGRSATLPMDYLGSLPANIDSAVRALSGGRSWIDLSRLDD